MADSISVAGKGVYQRHSNLRRRCVAHGNGLDGAGAVTARVNRGPGAGDDLGAADPVADDIAVLDGDGPQASVAVATPVALVVVSAGHSSTRLVGQTRFGAVVSPIRDGLERIGGVAALVGSGPRRETIFVAPQPFGGAVTVSDGDRATAIQGGGDAVSSSC